jgi:hypothetical protein
MLLVVNFKLFAGAALFAAPAISSKDLISELRVRLGDKPQSSFEEVLAPHAAPWRFSGLKK